VHLTPNEPDPPSKFDTEPPRGRQRVSRSLDGDPGRLPAKYVAVASTRLRLPLRASTHPRPRPGSCPPSSSTSLDIRLPQPQAAEAVGVYSAVFAKYSEYVTALRFSDGGAWRRGDSARPWALQG